LTNHIEIHTLELEKWRKDRGRAPAAVERWMAFFAEAETWAAVPEELANPALEEAMSVLTQFKTNAGWNDAYRARVDWQQQENTRERAVADSKAREQEAIEREQAAILRAEAERADKEQARAEAEQLREQLRQAGIEPRK
jgi:hypothetical protein